MHLTLKAQLSELQKKSLCAQTFLLFQWYELFSQKVVPLSTNLADEQEKSAATESAKKKKAKGRKTETEQNLGSHTAKASVSLVDCLFFFWF